MISPENTPLERAKAKLEQVERELKKHPDFHLYLIAKSRQERLRMKQTLMEIPHFKLWLTLRNSIALASGAAQP